MAGYDPKRRRQRPQAEGPSPVDAILGEPDGADGASHRRPVSDDAVRKAGRTIAKDAERPTVAKRLPASDAPEERGTDDEAAQQRGGTSTPGGAEPGRSPEPAALSADAPETSVNDSRAHGVPTRSDDDLRPPSPAAPADPPTAVSGRSGQLASLAFLVAAVLVVIYLLRRRRG